MGINSCGWSKHCLKRHRGYKLLWVEQTFRLFIILTMVISWRKTQWYIVSQLFLEQNILQTWSLVFLPPYETVSFIKINILYQSKNFKNRFKNSNFWRWSCDIQFHKYAVYINGIFDKLRPQMLSVGTTANAALSWR